MDGQINERMVTASQGYGVRSLALLGTLLGLIGVTAVVAVGWIWFYGNGLLAPIDNFSQGPGGAMAYSSLYIQLEEQSEQFWQGQEIQLVMNQAEFSGMLSSALLSGQRPTDPIRKVRAALLEGQIRVETVLSFADSRIPSRYRGPIGLRLGLYPKVAEDGAVQFKMIKARVGRIPIPIKAIELATRIVPFNLPAFDPKEALITLPLQQMIAGQLGRGIEIRAISVAEEQLTIAMRLPIPGQN